MVLCYIFVVILWLVVWYWWLMVWLVVCVFMVCVILGWVGDGYFRLRVFIFGSIVVEIEWWYVVNIMWMNCVVLFVVCVMKYRVMWWWLVLYYWLLCIVLVDNWNYFMLIVKKVYFWCWMWCSGWIGYV